MRTERPSLIQIAIVWLLAIPALYVVFLVYLSGNLAIAIGAMLLVAAFLYIYLSRRATTYRYLFPGLLGFGVFVIFPLIYTFVIGFTKYEASNLLQYNRVKNSFLEQTYQPEGSATFHYTVYQQANADLYRLLFEDTKDKSTRYWSDGIELSYNPLIKGAVVVDRIEVALAAAPDQLEGTVLALPDLTRGRLYIPLERNYVFTGPNGEQLRMDGLRKFSTLLPLWKQGDDDSLVNQLTGAVIQPDHERGCFVDADGEKVGFGFRTWAGLDNYRTIVSDERVKGPFIDIFIWTFIFAGLSVVLTFALGMTLAVMLEWEALRGRKVYRTLLILPYAVPAFLSILVFQGMFNQEAGAVNEFLEAAFGIGPEWNTSPGLAKTMVIIVNLWLGYPYMMLICTGVLQSIPKQIYEASSIDGSNTWHDFFKLTLPLVLPPLLPLLIASFAFNFNNFNLIFLLTRGGPTMVNSTGVAGETDILVTYTFNLAFLDSGNNYGLACAIATILFFIVGTLAWINLKLTSNKAAHVR